MSGTERKQLGVKISFFRLGVLKGVGRRTAGIGNANIEASETSLNRCHKRGNCRRISHIKGLMKDFATSRSLDLCASLGERPWGASANGNVSAFASQLLSDSSAQACAGGRDYGHTTTEPQIHFPSQ